MRLALAALIALAPAGLAAQVHPTPGSGDPRIQTVLYDADQVVQLQGTPGFQIDVEFAADEAIENVAVGDSAAWQVTPNRRGDHLFVKPLLSGVTTNMTVVTSARTYFFELVRLSGGGHGLIRSASATRAARRPRTPRPGPMPRAAIA